MTVAVPKKAMTMAEIAAQQVLREGGGKAAKPKGKWRARLAGKAKADPKAAAAAAAAPEPAARSVTQPAPGDDKAAPSTPPSPTQPAAQQAAVAAAFATTRSPAEDAGDIPREHDHIAWASEDITDSDPVIRAGLWTVGASSALFLAWALLFPLSSAVITPGAFVAQGGNQRIQHASGGTISRLLVKEGDRVRAGQPILEIDPVRARAEHTKLQARQLSLTALSKRLKMEMNGQTAADTFGESPLDPVATGSVLPTTFVLRGSGGEPLVLEKPVDAPTELRPLAPAPVVTPPVTPVVTAVALNDVIDSQRDAYLAGRMMLSQEVEALERKADTLDKRREGVETRLATETRILERSQSEYKRVKELAALGYVARNRAEERRTALMEQTGKVESLRSDADAVDAQIDEIDAQISKVRASARDEASRELTRIVSEMAEISDQIAHTAKTLSDTVLRAPVAGRIANLAANTIGEVIGAGDMLAEIVPAGRALTVEARVAPVDIANVTEGQEAEIAVTAFNRRLDDTLRGRVTHVAPDTSTSPDGNETWFNVRLAIEGVTGHGEARLDDVHAGMQAEVYINTGAQTFASWMMKPVTDSFRRAFREK